MSKAIDNVYNMGEKKQYCPKPMDNDRKVKPLDSGDLYNKIVKQNEQKNLPKV